MDKGRFLNRFGGWLGKNSTMGKNFRLWEDLRVHVLASHESNLGRETLWLDYLTLLLKHLTEPLWSLPKDDAVKKVVELMNLYSTSQKDFDTIVELSKFKGSPNPLEGIQPAVKAALAKAYKEGSSSGAVKTTDLITLPVVKKTLKKRIAAILEPGTDEVAEDNADLGAESDEEGTSDTQDAGFQVQVDLKSAGRSGTKRAPNGRGKGGSKATPAKKIAQSSGGSAKRKRQYPENKSRRRLAFFACYSILSPM